MSISEKLNGFVWVRENGRTIFVDVEKVDQFAEEIYEMINKYKVDTATEFSGLDLLVSTGYSYASMETMCEPVDSII